MELTPFTPLIAVAAWAVVKVASRCIVHGNGHGAGEQVAGAQGIGAGHAVTVPVRVSKVPSSVTWALWPTEIGGIGGGESSVSSVLSCRG